MADTDIQWLDAPASVDADHHAPRGIPCEACGTPVEPLDRFCGACGTTNPRYHPPATGPAAVGFAAVATSEVIDAELVPAAAPTRSPIGTGASAAQPVPEVDDDDQKHFRCETCGAEMKADPQQRSYICPFCDSTYVVEFSPQATGRQRPEFAIGFAVTPDQAQAAFKKWIGENGWFQPGDLATASIADKLKGIYLPFWNFSMLAHSSWGASIGEYWYRTETYTTTDSKGNTTTHTRRVQETEWRPLGGKHHRYYSGYLVSGSKGLPQDQAMRVLPFQLPALKRYEPYFLAGWLSEEYSVDREQALALCQQEFYRQEQSNIGAFLPGDTHSQLQVETNFDDVNSDLCLLPIYLLTYRYEQKVYRFLMNGQTGRVAGDKPLSQRRIAVAVGVGLALAAVVALIVFLLSRT